MDNAAIIGLSRQAALQRSLDVVAQNVANMNTTGFKAEQVRFREVLTTTDPTAKIGRQINFVIDQGLVRDLKEGGLARTGNTYDVAIAGDGYFAIQTPDGPRYTRNGNFTVDTNGRLVTSEGRPVLNTNDQPITIPATAGEVVIAGDGTISSGTNQISKIKVMNFDKPQNLDRIADGLYKASVADPGRPIQRPRMIQGTLEQSNVQPVVEMTRLIGVQRAYEGARSLVDTANQMSTDAIRRLGQRAA
jgi:flagellar basal-body rod protein FlgF